MTPVIALVGRPNVGKSTLFNRLTRSREALVADVPGLTRDRRYGQGRLGGRRFIVIDTGGISGELAGGIAEGKQGARGGGAGGKQGGVSDKKQSLEAAMAGQSMHAAAEADVVFLMADAKDGLTGADEQLITWLRERGKAFHLVVNKIDGSDEHLALAEFHGPGVSALHGIAALRGRGVQQLLEAALPPGEGGGEDEDGMDGEFADDSKTAAAAGNASDTEDAETVRAARSAGDADHAKRAASGGIGAAPAVPKIAVIGRPNVGKSTLVNRLLGEERVVVFNEPGTTRDSIYIDFERAGRRYTLIDTAGVRRRHRPREAVEKFSIVKTLKAIEDAHIVVLVADAQEGADRPDGQQGIVEQDLHLLGHAADAGRGLVIAMNKWDGLAPGAAEQVRRGLQRRLQFIDYADVHFISALRGTGIKRLYASIHQAFESATRELPTPALSRILGDAVAAHAPPLVNGRRIKLRYAHAGGRNPPRIVIHGNQTGKVPESYRRYLQGAFRRELDLRGTPVRIEFRTADNPYSPAKRSVPKQPSRRNPAAAKQSARKRHANRPQAQG